MYRILCLSHLWCRETVCLCNDWDEVDFVLQPLEELEVNLPEAVAVGRDKVEAAVHAGVHNVLSVQAALALK
jgi:hypothetical protein